ncbi:MAG: L,D-transpeptidase [Candidatus Competibacter sp.]
MRVFNRQVILLGVLAWLIGGCTTNEVQTPPTPPPLAPNRATVPNEPWLLVDTKADRLVIMRGEQPVQVFHQVALGSSGAGLKFRRGDNKTPLGVFRVGWINDHSRFKKFIGLDYPNLDYAEQALREHRIDRLTYERIRSAWVSGRTPPQDTPLGGQIGIHGVGIGDPGVQSAGINWTSGCVALDNRQIDALRPWVKVGMRVEIR